MCIVCVEETVAGIGVASMLWPKLRSIVFNFLMRRKAKRALRTSSYPANSVPSWNR
jgi:hypothetical protein